jgi:hypothetical protein
MFHYVATHTVSGDPSSLAELKRDLEGMSRQWGMVNVQSEIIATRAVERDKTGTKFVCTVLTLCECDKAPFGFSFVRNPEKYHQFFDTSVTS